MFFILRMVFWIAVVALLLPASPGRPGTQAQAHLSAGALADKAVSAAISYCSSSPEQCAAGLAGANRLGGLLSGRSGATESPAPTSLAQHFTALPPPRPAIP